MTPSVDELLEELGPLDDDNTDPLADLEPQWQLFYGHLLEHFNPATLPPMLAPLAPAAIRILAAELGKDSVKSRETICDLIELAVRDLGITHDELAYCWTPEPGAG